MDQERESSGFSGISQENLEAQLRASEERQRLLIEAVKDHAIFTLDPSGRITSWNEGARRLLGYRDDEALARISRWPSLRKTARLAGPGKNSTKRPPPAWPWTRTGRCEGRHPLLGERHYHRPARTGWRLAGLCQDFPRPHGTENPRGSLAGVGTTSAAPLCWRSHGHLVLEHVDQPAFS